MCIAQCKRWINEPKTEEKKLFHICWESMNHRDKVYSSERRVTRQQQKNNITELSYLITQKHTTNFKKCLKNNSLIRIEV